MSGGGRFGGPYVGKGTGGGSQLNKLDQVCTGHIRIFPVNR